MSGKLYTFPNNFRAQKIEIAAKYSGYQLELGEFVVGETNKSPEFLKKFPLGKVPAFEENEFRLFETNAIAYYVGNSSTRGGDKEAEVIQWLGFADNSVLPAACTWVYPTLGIMQYNKQATEKAKEDAKAALQLLNDHLLTRTFLVGERVTQADISVACTLLMLYQNVLEPSFRAPFGNTNRWFTTLINQPQFKAVLGDVELCTKMAQFDAKKYNEISGKGVKKEGKKEATPKKKEEKKPAKKNDEAKEAGDQPAPVPKKDPWANAPKPSMDLDAWKRCYSNSENEVAWKYFMENFKSDDYSIWHMKYMYNNELTQSFMAGNLVRGMFQRLDKMRKNSFGSCIIFGEDNNLEIEGVWFWLGNELAFTLSTDWQVDYEQYEWTKLDFKSEDVQKMVQEFWSGEGNFNGRSVCEQKIYK